MASFKDADPTLGFLTRKDADVMLPRPTRKIIDPTELADYRLRKRKEFEDQIRRERTLEVDHRNPTLWRNYAEAEMKNKFINHARNVWDRAVTLLPRVD
ncbi:hypothetical protein L3X38_044583 [Prunus dulcis]|uniref:Uncharacterized protein n=1 Tax=Prunus dulcis TaxID=3755 RepID=A0AAD4V115_PRUDU|nr:hypothetical protein L3X38_044583 [Prunus dulcis]